MDFKCSDPSPWKEALSEYPNRIQSLNKPNLVSLDEFYRLQLPSLIHPRNPNPHITTSELSKLMQWKLTRGKWRPRLLDMVSSLDDSVVKSASQKAFQCLPDISKAVSELTVLKGIGPATASAVLAAYAPDVAPFMSDEAMEAALGNAKDYTLKQYLLLVDKLQSKAKLSELSQIPCSPHIFGHLQELSVNGESFTPSDIERALWSASVSSKLQASESDPHSKTKSGRHTKRKRKR